ncbi:hypothetical protein ND933_12640 [Vibrio diabolicus]|uniref:hypothetical protein n=1 Tax=Vibrio diabolicus TaxID=50719 RepID=UPI00215E6B9B|nr:hypothetical protein [Vibrio diabolicus]MCS0454854.1 hypothetical protein [Vibrio diabolicus]
MAMIAFFFSFSTLGQEQLILRFSQKYNDNIKIELYTLISILLSILLFMPLSFMIFGGNEVGINTGNIIVLSVLASVCKISYQVYRVRECFFLAQVSLNFWKLAVLILLLLYHLLKVELIFVLSLSIGLILLCIQIKTIKFISIEHIRDRFSYSFNYFISMGVMSLFVYSERFILEGKITSLELSEYLYSMTISLSPYAIIASYLGFKEAVKYKNKFSLTILRNDILLGFRALVLFSVFWFLILNFFSSYIGLILSLETSILLMTIGIVKCLYSYLSSAMTIVMSSKVMFKVNLITVFSSIIFYIILNSFISSILLVLLFILLLWLARSLSVTYFLTIGVSDND